MKPWHFGSFLLLNLIIGRCIYLGGAWLVLPFVFIFAGIPVLDFLVGINTKNPTEHEAKSWKRPAVYLWWPFVYCLLHFYSIVMNLLTIGQDTTIVSLIKAVLLGMLTGGVGITVAHELSHKKEWSSRFMADLLLASVCYQHFAIEHVRGHHLHVATPVDPASARKGESFWRFYPRTVFGSFASAWNIERRRLAGRPWTIHNSFLRGIGLSVGFMGISYALAGGLGLVCFLLQSIVAFTLLELVNYVEHYGLSRKELGEGKYEKVTVKHSWNSSHWVSNALLFNLQRHSDHHAYAHLPYTVLRHDDSAPQLPSGYPAMIVLALIPPLWFKVMNPRLPKPS